MSHLPSSRRRPRTSRVLLIILALAVIAGIVTFTKQYNRNHSAVASNAAPPPTPAVRSVSAIAEDVGPAVTQTPTHAPAPATTNPSKPAPAPAVAKTPAATTAPSTGSKPQNAVASNVVLSSKPLQDAKAKVDAGKLLDARDIYNAAIISAKLSPDELKAAKIQLSAVNDKLVFSPRVFDGDQWSESFPVPPGGVMAKIAKRYSVTPELLCRVNEISDPKRLQMGKSIKVVKGPIHAVVDKSDFTIDLYFGAPGGPGSSYITTYRVGLGKDDSTPTGKWLCEAGKKLTNPTYFSSRGQGVIDKDDPKNPLGEYWIGLTGLDGQALGKTSYGIHGTIEPESIGTMASQGCIRLKNEDVARVYEMLVEGKSTVVVQD